MWLLCGPLAVISLWLRTGFPVHAIADASYDDALFVRGAYALSAHQWLGPFDQLTLAKGMGYPWFIRITGALGLPLKLAEQALYLLICGLLVREVAARTGRPWAAGLLFMALALNPVMWHPELARVIREGIYLSQSLALIVLVGLLLFPARKRTRLRTGLLAAFTGLVFGMFWLTREEGVWILPALVVLATMKLVQQGALWRRCPAPRPALVPTLARVILPMATVFVFANGVIQGVKAIHLSRYGVFESTEFHSAHFTRAYGALARIRHDQPLRYVVFPADARQRAYAVSPAARELQPFLEGDSGNSWRLIGCRQLSLTDCPDVLSGWFMWAFRDATALAGHYRSAPDAMAFYDRLTREINDACERKTIPCNAARNSLKPAWAWEDLQPTLTAVREVLPVLLGLGDGQIGVSPSYGAPDRIERFRQMVGPVALPEAKRFELRGWIAGAGHLPTLSLASGAAAPQQPWTLQLLDAPDVEQAFPGMTARRIHLQSGCAPGACTLSAQLGAQSASAQMGTGPLIDTPTLKLHGDSWTDHRTDPIVLRQQRLQAAVRPIAKLYEKAWPFVAAAGAVVLLIAAWQWLRRPRPDFLLAVALACLAAVAVRTVLLAYLEATSIPSVNVLYASPASPMVLIFPLLALLLALRWRRQ